MPEVINASIVKKSRFIFRVSTSGEMIEAPKDVIRDAILHKTVARVINVGNPLCCLANAEFNAEG